MKSFRIYYVPHGEGRMSGTLMRRFDKLFDVPPPSAYGASQAEIERQLEPQIVELEAKDCWTLGPAESRLRRLQAEYSRIRNRENATGSSPSQGESGDADFGRTSLRSLFRSSGGGTR